MIEYKKKRIVYYDFRKISNIYEHLNFNAHEIIVNFNFNIYHEKVNIINVMRFQYYSIHHNNKLIYFRQIMMNYLMFLKLKIQNYNKYCE